MRRRRLAPTSLNAEVRLSAGVLAVIALFGGLACLRPVGAFDDGFLADFGIYVTGLGWLLIVHSAMLMGSLLVKCRPLRQWGLVVGAFTWFTIFCVFLNEWVLRASTLVAVLAAIAYFAALILDVSKKPRCKHPPPSSSGS